MSENLIFFDEECRYCRKAVSYIIDLDKERKFRFASFNGKTAQAILTGPNERYREMNSLVLVENYSSTMRQFYARSKATLRIYWFLGSKWRLVGCLAYLPGWTSDFFYTKLAEHRHQFKIKLTQEIGPAERFLP